MTPIRWLSSCTFMLVIMNPILGMSESTNLTNRTQPSKEYAELLKQIEALKHEACPVASPASHLVPIDPARYQLDTGDVLMISLWGEKQQSIVQTISAEGEVTVPVIGELWIRGFTVKQAEVLLTKAVSRYYKSNVHAGIMVQGLRCQPNEKGQCP